MKASPRLPTALLGAALALWTVTESFDQEEFIAAFSKQVRENLEGSGQAWTDPVAAAVRRHAENRWGDIQQILERAGT